MVETVDYNMFVCVARIISTKNNKNIILYLIMHQSFILFFVGVQIFSFDNHHNRMENKISTSNEYSR